MILEIRCIFTSWQVMMYGILTLPEDNFHFLVQKREIIIFIHNAESVRQYATTPIGT
jgi:hypothetical protein